MRRCVSLFVARGPFDLNEFADTTKETLDGDELRVVRKSDSVSSWSTGSRIETCGDALDLIAAAGPAGRRAMVDAARVGVGLPTIEDAQFKVRQEAKTARSAGLGDHAIAACGCNVWATNPSGSCDPLRIAGGGVRSHRDQAGPEDHLPEPPRYVLSELRAHSGRRGTRTDQG